MVLSMDRWVGKVALVTGASSGIGAAIAKSLVQKGVVVVGVARHVHKIQAVKGKLYPLQADLSKEEDILKIFQWTTENLGPVHILINCAGVMVDGPLTGGRTDDWRKVIDVNLLGLSVATREAVQIMKEHEINGHIVHINSRAGHSVPNFGNLNVYAATKYGVTALAETLRLELNSLGLRIKITSVSPGLVRTGMTVLNSEISKEKLDLFQKVPIIEPEDIADGVVYALSTPEHVQVHELTIAPLGEIF